MSAQIVISDLSHCRPDGALHRGYRPGTWRLIDYETTEFAGTMVYSGPGAGSPPLTLPLGRQGMHAIYLGVHYPEQFSDAHVQVRLSDDPAYSLVRAEKPAAKDMNGMPEELRDCIARKRFADYQVSEAFWKVADLGGQDLVISRSEHGPLAGTYGDLVHVRLQPLSEARAAAHRQEQPRADTRRLIAMNDGGIFTHLANREDIHAQFEPYRDSDVEIMMWAPFKGENCTYRSRVARGAPTDANPFDRFATFDPIDQTLRRLESQGIDFLPEVVTGARAAGVRVFSSLRLQGPKPPPLDLEVGTLYDRHREFRCRDRQGRPVSHLSMAFPEVRQHWISLLTETLEAGFDGVHVLYCRSHPFVYYDEPVIERFRQEFGEDPRDHRENDPRFWRVMAYFVTEFMRDLRRTVDAMAAATGRRLQIAYSINSTQQSRLLAPGIDPATRPEVEGGAGSFGSSELLASNLMWGVDVETMVREELADYLLPHPAFARNAADWLPDLMEMVRDTPVEVYPDLYPRRQPPAAALYSAETLYHLGCDGLSLWDTYNRVPRLSEWAMMRRLGHREEIPTWRAAGRGDDYFRVLDFVQLDGQSGDSRYFQTNG